MTRFSLRRLTAVLATIPVLMLAACAGDNAPEPGASTPATPGASATGAEQVTLSLALNTEPAEVPVLQELISRFESANPSINIELSNVPYDQLLQQLPLQLESGEAPDIMRLTLFEYAPYLLDLSPYVSDVDYWMTNMGSTQEILSKAGGGEPHPVGVFLPVTVTGAFVNTTLFEQAGVAMPADNAGWEEWAAATRKVADATGTTAMAVDRSGHRLVGPALSRGAKYLDDDGNFTFAGDQAFTDWVRLFVDLNQDGTMAKDVWVSSATFKDAREAFVNGELVFYYSGNWQVASIDQAVGDAFDWAAITGPGGEAGSYAMAGGGYFAGFQSTKHPEQVAAFLDWLAQEDQLRYWAENTLGIPQHTGLVATPIDFQGVSEQGIAALEVFGTVTNQVPEAAQSLLASPIASTIYNSTRDRITQAIAGELTVEEAVQKIQTDVDQAVANADSGR